MLLSSSNRKYPPFPLVSYFFRGCVPDMFAASHSLTHCIYVPGKPGICFHYYCAVYDECKYSDTFWLADRTRLFVHHLIIIIVQTYLKALNLWNACQIYFVECVRLTIFSPLPIIQYVGLYVFSLPISLVMIVLLSSLKSEVWTTTHRLGLCHETMVSAVCLSIFFWNSSPSPA